MNTLDQVLIDVYASFLGSTEDIVQTIELRAEFCRLVRAASKETVHLDDEEMGRRLTTLRKLGRLPRKYRAVRAFS